MKAGMWLFGVVSLLSLGSDAVVAQTQPIGLFNQIEWSTAGFSPPLPDAIEVYRSGLNVRAVAGKPETIAFQIPRPSGALTAWIHLESMDRREGFAERDAWACSRGDLAACEIIPIPDLPENQFSYTWTGQGDGYDLRLTVHRGNAVGIISGPAGRFALSWTLVKELRAEFFVLNDLPGDPRPEIPLSPLSTPAAAVPMTAADVRNATVARIEPKAVTPNSVASVPMLDMLVLFTEDARRQAGGNAAVCADTNGIMAYIQQGVNDINTAFSRSAIAAQVGVVTVSKLNGYVPETDDGTYLPSLTSRDRIQNNANIRGLRNAVGADVVAVLVGSQASLGPCGITYVQRTDCSGQAAGLPTSCLGAPFSEWTYYLNSVQCSSSMDVFTHEMGHILGAEHNPDFAVPPSMASYPYAYGYFVSGQFQTVMSQEFGSGSPPRLLQFSNPNVSYNGLPTGNAADANNAQALSNLVGTVESFRTRPPVIFANGFDGVSACPALNF